MLPRNTQCCSALLAHARPTMFYIPPSIGIGRTVTCCYGSDVGTILDPVETRSSKNFHAKGKWILGKSRTTKQLPSCLYIPGLFLTLVGLV